jgi:hypothetical protein
MIAIPPLFFFYVRYKELTGENGSFCSAISGLMKADNMNFEDRNGVDILPSLKRGEYVKGT